MSGATVPPESEPFWLLGKGPVEPAGLEPWTLPRILQARARLQPDAAIYKVRAENGFTTVTWSVLRKDVEAVGAGLAGLGLERGDRVAVLGASSPLWVAVDLAILTVGGITVGIYPTSSVPEIVDQLDHVGAKVIVILDHADVEHVVEATRACRSLGTIVARQSIADDGRTISIEQLLASGRALVARRPDFFDEAAAQGHIDDPMRLFFTSGSTGRPKAVLHTQRSLILSADAVVIRNPAMRLVPQRCVAFLPLSHISPVLNILLIPMITSTVAYFARGDQDVISLIKDTRPTYLALMPRQYQKLSSQLAEATGRYSGLHAALFRRALAIGSAAIRRHWNGERIPVALALALRVARWLVFKPLLATVGLDAVTRAQTTSAAMPRDVAALWCVYGLDLREGYGSTEAPVIACQLEPFPAPGTVGKKMPKPWYELKFAEDGEILIRSAILFAGFWHDPEETGRSKVDGWYKTGDIGELDKNGDIRLVGRKKDIIITAGGKSLNPQDLEAPFRNSPYISEIVILGEAKKFVAALIELSGDAVQAWARRNGMPAFSDHAGMAGSAAVATLIADEIAKGNVSLSRVARIKAFRILPRPLDIAKGEITATRKVRRGAVVENFAYLVDEIYGTAEEAAIAAQLKNAKL